jgi:DNA-binding NarL/FixJ family response regulator
MTNSRIPSGAAGSGRGDSPHTWAPRRERVLVLAASPIRAVRERWREALRGRTVHEIARLADVASRGRQWPAVLLLDARLCPADETHFAATIRRLRTRTRVILAMSRPDERKGLTALRAGARGYVATRLPPVALRKAVERVLAGEIWTGRKPVARMLNELTSATARQELARSRPRRQSPHRQIARLVARGASTEVRR